MYWSTIGITFWCIQLNRNEKYLQSRGYFFSFTNLFFSLSLSVWTKVFLFLYAFNVDNENANSTAFFLLKSSSVWKFYRWIHAVINLCLVINVLNLCMHSFFEFSIGYADAYCGWAFQYRKIICGIVGNGSQGNNLREEKSFTLMY